MRIHHWTLIFWGTYRNCQQRSLGLEWVLDIPLLWFRHKLSRSGPCVWALGHQLVAFFKEVMDLWEVGFSWKMSIIWGWALKLIIRTHFCWFLSSVMWASSCLWFCPHQTSCCHCFPAIEGCCSLWPKKKPFLHKGFLVSPLVTEMKKLTKGPYFPVILRSRMS